MYQNRRIDLRLSDRDIAVLDKKRGRVTRSRYLRWLIHHGPDAPTPRTVTDVPLPEDAT